MLGRIRWRFLVAQTVFVTLAGNGVAGSLDLHVMSFNVWTAENTSAGRRRIIDVVEQAGADLVGFQEMGGSALRSIATSMGYYHYDQRFGSEAILSRYRIVEVASPRYGVLVELSPGHEAWIFNTHLFHAPYGPYQLNGIAYNGGRLYDPSLPENIDRVIRDQINARGRELDALLGAAGDAGALSAEVPVFLTGDFNEPSHLDWTAEAVAGGVHVTEVPWPASTEILAQGFEDSWRDVYPDVVTDPGRTWSPVYPSTYMNRGDGTAVQPHPVPEPQDRIDMVYYGGAQLEVIDSRRSGPIGGNVTEELEIARFPSDHNAVTSTFLMSGFDHTRLTFRSLGANGDEIPAGYGSRVLSSPDIAVDFSATGGSPERPAAWRYVDDSLWPKGVANLNSGEGESADGTATFQLLWTPDEAAAVHVDSFTLLDYPDGNGIGQTVRWELWGSDALMADGLASVPDDAQLQVTTDLAGAFAEPLELRLTHIGGVNDALGLDDLVFRQVIVPEPSSLALLLLCLLSASQRLRGSKNKTNRGVAEAQRFAGL